jgi:hypothetical protein
LRAFGWLGHSRNARLRLFTEDTPSFALTRTMKSLLFDTSASDPLTFAAIAVLLTGLHYLLAGYRRGAL